MPLEEGFRILNIAVEQACESRSGVNASFVSVSFGLQYRKLRYLG